MVSRLQPWGQFHNIFSKQANSEWAVIGCISAEERCTSIFRSIAFTQIQSDQLLFVIEDPISHSSDKIDQLVGQNRRIVEGIPARKREIVNLELISPFSNFEEHLRRFVGDIGNGNLIVDITSLPKKVYFYILKLVANGICEARNLVFVYSEAESYTAETLASNPESWEALPGYREPYSNYTERHVVIGVGFEPLGLPDLALSGKFDDASVTFLMSFPTQSSGAARNWRFIRDIFPNSEKGMFAVRTVDGTNLPEVYSALESLCGDRSDGIIFAPFGPKPMSLAMGVFAAHNSSLQSPIGVYYTQPTYYNPDYSAGIKVLAGQPLMNTYVLRRNGTNLYA